MRRRSRSFASSRRIRGLFKIGLQLYIAAGPDIVRAVRDLGGRVFLDLKLHDIPNTVGRAVESACSLGAEMLTMHLSGGGAMIEAAVRSAREEMLLLGVTVLTSADEATLRETGVNSSMQEQVLRLAQLGVESGSAGFVASPHELGPLRAAHGSEDQNRHARASDQAGADADDQKRVDDSRRSVARGRGFSGHRAPDHGRA